MDEHKKVPLEYLYRDLAAEEGQKLAQEAKKALSLHSAEG